MENRGTILWADDEIDYLKSHILFLEDKGYNVLSANSGEDAYDIFIKENIDLILLDEMMTGMDGIETLKKIKKIQPEIPIIMITKNEEEWLMEEAIASQISNYLIKPVNPTQIFIACKNILEKVEIQSEHIAKDFLSKYQSFNQKVEYAKSLEDWFGIYNDLCEWIVRFDKVDDLNLTNLLDEQFQTTDNKFNHFFSKEYKNLLSQEKTKQMFTPYTLRNNLIDDLKSGDKAVLIIMDCLRADQWKLMSRSLFSDYKIETKYQSSILPSTTFYSRNSIFSGLFPLELYNHNHKLYEEMIKTESNYNKFEHDLLKDQLLRNDLKKYVK